MADAPPYLPVIRTITKPDGSSMLPVDELRIMPSLVATRVVDDGPDRIELSVYTAPAVDWLPPLVAFPFPGIAAGTDSGGQIAFASLEAPSRFTRVDFIPGGALTADDTDYAIFDLIIVDTATGNQLGASLGTQTTQTYDATLRPNGTGNWTARKQAMTFSVGIEIPAGHSLAWLSTHAGSGAAVPDGAWRIT